MANMKYLGNFKIPNLQNKMDLFECECGYKTAVESDRFLNYEIYCNNCEQTYGYHLHKEETKKFNNILYDVEEYKKKYKGIKKYLTRMMIMLIISILSLVYLIYLNISNLDIDSSIYNILSVPLQGFILFLLFLMVNKEIVDIFEKRKNDFEDIANRYKNM